MAPSRQTWTRESRAAIPTRGCGDRPRLVPLFRLGTLRQYPSRSAAVGAASGQAEFLTRHARQRVAAVGEVVRQLTRKRVVVCVQRGKELVAELGRRIQRCRHSGVARHEANSRRATPRPHARWVTDTRPSTTPSLLDGLGRVASIIDESARAPHFDCMVGEVRESNVDCISFFRPRCENIHAPPCRRTARKASMRAISPSARESAQ